MMVKKSVLLMSIFAVELTLGSGAEAVKKPIPQVEGQSKLYDCAGFSSTTRQKIKATAEKAEKEEKQRKCDKENAQREARRWNDYLIKVSTVAPSNPS